MKISKMGETLARLEAEFCPPLDPSLLAAIVLDYDLDTQKGLADARKILDELKESASLEEQTGFDPSGTGAPDQDGVVDKRLESCPETSASLSHETDITSLSNGLTSIELDSATLSDGDAEPSVGEAEDLEKLDDETKIQLLQDVFEKQVSRYSIEHTLRKCDGKWNAAMEELLNHVYFNESETQQDEDAIKAKGIDGFSDEYILARTRKAKSRKKRAKSGAGRKTASLPESRNASPERQPNRWKNASEDIEFVSTRTGIAKATVSSTYYEKGASVPQTIGTLLKASMEESKLVVTDDDAVSFHARELGRDFPSIAPDYLSTIIRLTHPSVDSARELATALTARPKPEGGIQIVPRLAPLNGVHSAADWQSVSSRKAKSSSASPSPPLDAPSASTRREAYSLAQATAFAQASAAHRKAKSNRLMGGAAAYYGQVGREYAALSANASAAAAGELADSQSSSNQLDLHGVDVLNGVRIAKERVEQWWAGLGERRVNGRMGAEERQAGFRIVVGLGRHSEGGKGKLGPAVTKMLRQEGWRIESAGAVIVVKGPARRG